MKIYTALDIVNASVMKNDPDEMAVYFLLFVEIRTHAKFSRCHQTFRIYQRAQWHETNNLRNDNQRRYDHNNPKIIEIDATSRFVIDNEYFLLMTVFSIGGGIQ